MLYAILGFKSFIIFFEINKNSIKIIIDIFYF